MNRLSPSLTATTTIFSLEVDAMAAKRTRDVLIDEDLKFDSLLLKNSVLDGLRRIGFKRPSPVQLKAIPYGKCGFGKERRV